MQGAGCRVQVVGCRVQGAGCRARLPVTAAAGAFRQLWRRPGALAEVSARGPSRIRNPPLLGPCSRTKPRVIWRPSGGGLFLMSEVPLQSAGNVELAHLVHRGTSHIRIRPPP